MLIRETNVKLFEQIKNIEEKREALAKNEVLFVDLTWS